MVRLCRLAIVEMVVVDTAAPKEHPPPIDEQAGFCAPFQLADACMQYISTHINEPISAADVIAFSGRNRAYLFKKFQQELGGTIGAYITKRKLREAKSLLRYTDKSLGEISSYLCFSSQSYFQNVFKKHCGVTPLEYRSGVTGSLNK